MFDVGKVPRVDLIKCNSQMKQDQVINQGEYETFRTVRTSFGKPFGLDMRIMTYLMLYLFSTHEIADYTKSSMGYLYASLSIGIQFRHFNDYCNSSIPRPLQCPCIAMPFVR